MAHKLHKQYRLYGFDYAQNGSYFITIVTKERRHYFGEIENGVMKYNAIGQYVVNNIKSVQERKKDLIIDEWVVMPNHIHFLITLAVNKTDYTFITGLQPLNKQSISAFINHFKGYVKRWCNLNEAGGFDWQPRFHDHVIRNEKEYLNTACYIQNNIASWEQDDER